MLFTLVALGFAGLAVLLYSLSRIALPAATPLTQTTFVYDSAGGTLATYKVDNRVSVPLSSVPPVLVDAVVSTEDRHFFTEGAVSPIGIARALLSDLRGSGSLQGGSTITQQYVKQVYLGSQRTLARKIREAAIAVKLGHRDSKATVLGNYLNTIYFGRSAYGVQAASEAYFAKPVSAIGLREASLLAGLIREPETADPAHNAALARQNQAATLRALVRDGRVTVAAAAEVSAQPFSGYVVAPASSQTVSTSGAANAYFTTAVRQQLLARLPASEVDGGGLRVTTTLDPTLQAKAYDTVYGPNPNALDPTRGDPAGALVSVDASGAVRAMVGGKGYGAAYEGSQVNLALGTAGGGSGRQAGSTFKAFMLASLIKAGYSVNSTFPAPPEVVIPHGNANGTPWDVKNFEGEIGSPTTSLIDATAQSVNTVYAQVVDKLGAQSLDNMAVQLGIAPSELSRPYPSQVLGSADVSPLEMAAAYATFANQGVYTSPVLITRVVRADGTVVPWPARTSHQVLNAHDAAVLTYVLQQVVLRGTAGAAGGLGAPVAGKTGTTENSANAWFIGYTPKLTTAVWMGYPAGNTPIVAFRHNGHFYKSVQGGDVPAQLWHSYMASALASQPSLGGQFPIVYYFGGQTLVPPAASSLQFPRGIGPPTTAAPSTPVATSPGSAPTTTTAGGGGGAASTTGGTRTPTTFPATTTTRPSTVPRTTPSTAAPTTPATTARG